MARNSARLEAEMGRKALLLPAVVEILLFVIDDML